MLYVEDDAHLALVFFITDFARKQVKKSSGKSRVVKFLRIYAGSLGLIDEDTNLKPEKHEPKFLRAMNEVASECNVVIRRASNESFAIALIPDVEGWVLDIAKKYGINTKKYGLPNTKKELHEVVGDRIKSFQKLIDVLKDKQEMLYLKDMLEKYYRQ